VEQAMSFHRILIAVTEDPIAIYAAGVGVELADALNAEVAFIYVVDPLTAAEPERGTPVGGLTSLAEARAALAKLLGALHLARSPLALVADGSAAREIVKAAGEWRAELIVLGTHGRRGVRQALLGSVAESVMRHAPCPVLVSPAGQ
jgi:nucleotide-binding universal stress UspA family protein